MFNNIKNTTKHIIFRGIITDARHAMCVLMGLSVCYIGLAAYVLRGKHLHEVASDQESSKQSALYENDFYSRLFQGAVAFTLIVALPTIMDIILSLIYLQSWEEIQQPIEVSRRYIFATIFVPNLFIYFKILPAALVDLTMFYQYLLVFFTLIYRIHTLSISQQKNTIVQAYPLRDMFLNCIGAMTMGFCYKIAVHGFLKHRITLKALYTFFLLVLQLLTCLKLKPWFNFTWQISKVVKNNIFLQNKIAFYSVMIGIITCVAMSIVDAITFHYEYIYFPASSKSFIAIEWLFCALLVFWTSVRNFEVIKIQIDTTSQLAYNRKMTRSISHEIRTPLNTAFMALDLLISSLNQQQQQDTRRSFEASDQVYLLKQQQERENETNNLLEIAESIKEGCDIALNILNQLLTFEKLSAGMLQLENKTLTINQLLDSNMKLFKMQAQQCGITFKLDRSNVDMDELMVHVDEHKMNQVIRNLLSNAMKFTPRGGVVEVKLQWVQPKEREMVVSNLLKVPSRSDEGNQNSMDDDSRTSLSTGVSFNKSNKLRASLQHMSKLFSIRKSSSKATTVCNDTPIMIHSNVPMHQKISGFIESGSILISIVDTGPGVNASDQKKLFQEYVQINPGELQKGQGTGLGLSISKSIVHLHGGNIGMTSEGKGKGSTFYIELPCFESSSDANEDMLGGLYDSVLDSRIFGGALSRKVVKPSEGSQRTLSKNIHVKHISRDGHNGSKDSYGEADAFSPRNNTHITHDVLVLSDIEESSKIVSKLGTATDTMTDTDIEQGIDKLDTHPSHPVPLKAKSGNDLVGRIMKVATSKVIHPTTHHSAISPIEDDEVDGYNTVSIPQSDDAMDHKAGTIFPGEKEVKFSVSPRVNDDNADAAKSNLIQKSAILHKGKSFSVPPSYRILIVDDSIPNRKMLNRLLSRESHIVTEASNGLEAVEMVYETMQENYRNPQYDLILMDYYMPHMTGPEAIKAIRHIGYKGMILGVSGVMDDDVNLFIDAGANLVLCKPLTLSALWKALHGSSFFDELDGLI